VLRPGSAGKPALALCLLAMAWGCRQAPASSQRLVRDPMVVAVDGATPSNGLDGQGTLFLGDGWGQPEGSGGPGDWGSMAWVVGTEAFVHLLLPPGATEMDFFARCLPFPWDAHAPLQRMEVLAAGQVIGGADLIRDWQDVRIPLPARLPGNRLLTLHLRFAHALKPADLGAGGDPRSLAAAFTQLALIPRSVPDPKSFLAAQSFDQRTGQVILPVGGGLRLPLPAASHIHLQLRSLRAHCHGCRLSLELAGSLGSVEPLSAESSRDAGTLDLGFDTAPGAIQSLWIRVTGDPAASSLETMEFVLGPVSADLRQRAQEDNAAPPDIFIYMIDTLRADELGPYGGKPGLTPHMDAFAREAVTYTQARAASTWTLPSVVSLLTGLYPDRHGVTREILQYDPQKLRTLPQSLGRHGYRTVGISHSFIVSPTYGLSEGFGSFYYSDHLNSRALRSQEAYGLLACWLSQQDHRQPFFAYLHTVDPHAPYAPPPGFLPEGAGISRLPPQEEGLPNLVMARGKVGDRAEVAHLRALYDGEVRSTDLQLGRFIDLLKWLGLYDHSFVILVGDHGEEFAEHGGLEHGTTLFEEVLRVPLIVKYPDGRWAGKRIGRAVSLVDVAPTLLAALAPGQETPGDGKVLPGPEASGREHEIYFEVAPLREHEAPIDLRGLLVDGIKCIEDQSAVSPRGKPAPRLQAFDLAADPAERSPLADTAAAVARCRVLLDAWSRTRKPLKNPPSERRVTPEMQERLRALGYLR